MKHDPFPPGVEDLLPGSGYADTAGPCPVCGRPGTYVDVGMKGDRWTAYAGRWARVGDHVAFCDMTMLSCLDWPSGRTRVVRLWDPAARRWGTPLRAGDLAA